jgi:hypothetical protein
MNPQRTVRPRVARHLILSTQWIGVIIVLHMPGPPSFAPMAPRDSRQLISITAPQATIIIEQQALEG